MVLPIAAHAQTPGTLDTVPLPVLANPRDPALPAKDVFGRVSRPASRRAEAIGSYAKGCLAGAVALPADGETWQAMRPSRGRLWGHPRLIDLIEKLSMETPAINGWPGLLIGDLAQPRGGPMITGHNSHQIGLDADLWLTPMPDRRLSKEERETMSAIDMVDASGTDIDPRVWTPQHSALLKAVSSKSEVARVFVNPAIKKALCREAGADRAWLRKIRPMGGHNYHFHIRLSCPAADSACTDQDPVPPGNGCGDLEWWFTPAARKPAPPRPPLTLSQLPATCRAVLEER